MVFFREGHVDGEPSPALWPLIPSSKPGIIRPWPSPVRNQTLYRLRTLRRLQNGEVDGYAVFCFNSAVFFFPVACCLRRVSSMPSTSASVTSRSVFQLRSLPDPAVQLPDKLKLYRVSEVFTQLVFARNISRAPAGLIFSLMMASMKLRLIGHPERPGVQTRHNAEQRYSLHFAFAEAVNTYFFRNVDQLVLTAVSMLSAAIVIVTRRPRLEWFQLKLASCYLKKSQCSVTLTPQAQVVGFAEPGCSYNHHIPCYQNHPESIQIGRGIIRHHFYESRTVIARCRVFFHNPGQFSSECWAKSAKSRQNKRPAGRFS